MFQNKEINKWSSDEDGGGVPLWMFCWGGKKGGASAVLTLFRVEILSGGLKWKGNNKRSAGCSVRPGWQEGGVWSRCLTVTDFFRQDALKIQERNLAERRRREEKKSNAQYVEGVSIMSEKLLSLSLSLSLSLALSRSLALSLSLPLIGQCLLRRRRGRVAWSLSARCRWAEREGPGGAPMMVVVEVEVVLVRCWTSWSLIGDVGEVLILFPFPPRNPDRVFPQTLSSLPARGEIIDFSSFFFLFFLPFFFFFLFFFWLLKKKGGGLTFPNSTLMKDARLF